MKIIEKKWGAEPRIYFSLIFIIIRKIVRNLFIYIEEQLFFNQVSQGLYELDALD